MMEPAALVDRLKAHGFEMSLRDELRLATLLDHLRRSGGMPDDLNTFVDLIAPVVCRSSGDQARLPGALLGRTVAAKLESPVPPRGDSAPEPPPAPVEPGSRRRSWILSTLALAMALLLGIMLARAPWRLDLIWRRDQPLSMLSALAVGLVPVIVGTALLRRTRREAALQRGQIPEHMPAHLLKVSTADHAVMPLEHNRSTLRDLRRHIVVPTAGIDARASVGATAAAGGFPVLIQRRRPVSPEYILLTDRASTHDPLGSFSDALGRRLGAERIALVRAHYDANPALITLDRPSASLESIELPTLATRHPEARLMLIADPRDFWDPTSRDWRTWVKHLGAFKACFVMAPALPHAWVERMRMLTMLGVAVVPADARGLAGIALSLQRDYPPRLPDFEPALDDLDRILASEPLQWVGDISPSSTEVRSLVEALHSGLTPHACLLMSALAVFPIVHADLTEQIGRRLTLPDGQTVLTGRATLELAGLPWMRRGRFPDWLRKALIEALSPADSVLIRSVWQSILRVAPSALERSALISLSPDRRGLSRIVARVRNALWAPRQTILTERLLVAFLSGLAMPDLAMPAPDRIRDQLGYEVRILSHLALIVSGMPLALLLLIAEWHMRDAGIPLIGETAALLFMGCVGSAIASLSMAYRAGHRTSWRAAGLAIVAGLFSVLEQDRVAWPLAIAGSLLAAIALLCALTPADYRNPILSRLDAPAIRGLDIVISGLTLLILSPVLLIIASAVWADSGSPILFSSQRIGKNGKIFRKYSFRTMRQDADERLIKNLTESGAARAEWARDHKLRLDPRITRVGNFLRRTNIDIFPELINVFKGDMSLAGPRPIVEAEYQRYGHYIKYYLMQPPGFVGIWRTRSDVSYRRRVAVDVQYARSRSFFRQFRLLIATIPGVILARNSY